MGRRLAGSPEPGFDPRETQRHRADQHVARRQQLPAHVECATEVLDRGLRPVVGELDAEVAFDQGTGEVPGGKVLAGQSDGATEGLDRGVALARAFVQVPESVQGEDETVLPAGRCGLEECDLPVEERAGCVRLARPLQGVGQAEGAADGE